jgi:hypothetical protein
LRKYLAISRADDVYPAGFDGGGVLCEYLTCVPKGDICQFAHSYGNGRDLIRTFCGLFEFRFYVTERSFVAK